MRSIDKFIEGLDVDPKRLASTQDVADILKRIAPPGKQQEFKKQVIAKLFPGRNSQGISVSESLISYKEF